MASKNPVVVGDDGSLEELQSGDILEAFLALPGASGNRALISNTLGELLESSVTTTQLNAFFVASAGPTTFYRGDKTFAAIVQANIVGMTTADTVTFAGLNLGSGSLGMTGTLAASGSRATMGWFTDLDVSNSIVASITGNAATVGGCTISTDTTMGGLSPSDLYLPTQLAIRTYYNGVAAALGALHFIAVIDCSGNPNFPAASNGHVYKVSVAGKIGGASGAVVEVGDMLICTNDSTASGDWATVGQYWMAVQTNLDGAVIGPASSVSGNVAIFSGISGKLIADSNITLTSTGPTNVTLPTSGTLATLAGTEELTNKTLNASVGKGVWTASGTWTLPAFTLGGIVSGGGQQLNNIIIGATTPLAGAFTDITASGTLGVTGSIIGGTSLQIDNPAYAAVGPVLYLTNHSNTAGDAADILWGETTTDIRAKLNYTVKIGGAGELTFYNGATGSATTLNPALKIGDGGAVTIPGTLAVGGGEVWNVLGALTTAAVTADTTRYLNVTVGGVAYKLIVGT